MRFCLLRLELNGFESNIINQNTKTINSKSTLFKVKKKHSPSHRNPSVSLVGNVDWLPTCNFFQCHCQLDIKSSASIRCALIVRSNCTRARAMSSAVAPHTRQLNRGKCFCCYCCPIYIYIYRHHHRAHTKPKKKTLTQSIIIVRLNWQQPATKATMMRFI